MYIIINRYFIKINNEELVLSFKSWHYIKIKFLSKHVYLFPNHFSRQNDDNINNHIKIVIQKLNLNGECAAEYALT